MKYLLSVSFLTIGILISFSAENSEQFIYINYLKNWTFSLIISRIIPFIFIALSVSILLFNRLKKLYSLSIFIVIILLLEICIINTLKLQTTEIIILSASFLILIFSRFLNKAYLLNVSLIKNKILKNILITILVITSLFIPYIISPIANYALIDNPKEEINEKNIKLLNKYIRLDKLKDDSTTLVALFSTNCFYCFNAAKRIGITQKENNFCKIISVFPSNIEEIDQFINDANYSTNKIQCSKEDFLKLCKGRYPIYFLIKDKISKYDASSFQHRTIDLLSNL